MKIFKLVSIFIFTLYSFGRIYAQRNISGKMGFINIPDANTNTTTGDLFVGYIFNPAKYGIAQQGVLSEQVLYTDLALSSRLNVTFLLLQGREDGKRRIKEGIGDRQFDLRYQILKEKKNQPALVLIMSNPFSISAAFGSQAIVAGKTYQLHKKISCNLALGYGSSYYIMRSERNLNNNDILNKFMLIKKSEDIYKSDYLTGFFGGVKIDLIKKTGILLEWDSHKLNTGAYVKLNNSLTIQVAALKMDAFTYGLAYTRNLNTTK
jgi:hypothetical protein